MIPTQCKKCGGRFLATDSRQKLCAKCRTNRRHYTPQNIQFIGVDGEGVNRPDGSHEYILLSVGGKSLYYPDGRRLTCYDIIPFLWESFLQNPTAIYVGFYLGYDFTMWLRDLPENRAQMLLSEKGIAARARTKSGANHLPFPVEHRGFYFDMLPMKRMRLWYGNSDKRMYICDTGSYFQTSFLNVIDPEKWPDGSIVTPDEYKKIAIGKSERGQDIVPFDTPVSKEMIEYNVLENDVLGRLMTKYNEGLNNVGIKLKRDQWFGPGQAAQTWMNTIKAPTRKEFEDATNTDIRRRLRASYYGGWFEIFAHGHIEGISYSYDINSAYPDIQSRLPCCLHGRWQTGDESNRLDLDRLNDQESYLLLHATVHGTNDAIGCAPHRTRTGHILRPQHTKGWYWAHEIQAAKTAGLIDSIEIEEWIQYEPCSCRSPFRAERTLYEDRLRVGKNTIAGKARRLVYNSTYGKTAQSIGAAKYSNSFYASLITSQCRTRILRAIASHPIGASDVLMVATDGIVFRNRHTNLNPIDSTELGAWTEGTHQNLCLFMPGIYWDDSSREKLRDGEHPSLKSRGIPAKALADRILEIDDAFRDPFSGNGFPVIDLPINFSIVSPKQALARRKWQTCGLVSFDGIRRINSDPYMKRAPGLLIDDEGIIRSTCYEQGPELESTPYSKSFGDKELDSILTPDGDIDMLLADTLR